MNDKKVVNGEQVLLTDQEQAERQAEMVAYEQERPDGVELPDPASQIAAIASALIDKGVLERADISEDVLAAINLKLSGN